MPIDPSPDGAGLRNKPLSPVFPQPTPGKDIQESDEQAADTLREAEAAQDPDELVTPESEQLTHTTRPPLGN